MLNISKIYIGSTDHQRKADCKKQLNPMVSWTKAYRNVLYDLRFPSLERWLAILSATFVVLYLGFKVFNRLEPRMAEEV